MLDVNKQADSLLYLRYIEELVGRMISYMEVNNGKDWREREREVDKYWRILNSFSILFSGRRM